MISKYLLCLIFCKYTLDLFKLEWNKLMTISLIWWLYLTILTKLILSLHQVENGDQLETINLSPGMHQMMIQGGPGQEPQLVQVVSLKDATLLSKAMEAINSGNVKAEDTIIMEQ